VDHVASLSRIARGSQRAIEVITVPMASEHFLRRPLTNVKQLRGPRAHGLMALSRTRASSSWWVYEIRWCTTNLTSPAILGPTCQSHAQIGDRFDQQRRETPVSKAPAKRRRINKTAANNC